MFRVLSGRQAGLPAGLRATAIMAAAALPLALATAGCLVLAPAEAWARIGTDDVDSDAPSPFAVPDPAGHGGGEDEPLPEGAFDPPPLPGDAAPAEATDGPDAGPAGAAQPAEAGPNEAGPNEAGPNEAGPNEAGPAEAPAGPDERGPAGTGGDEPALGAPADDAPTPFGVDPNLDIRPPTVDVVPDTSPLPEVHYGEAGLPEPVRKTRAAILEAARGGDIEALRAVLETSEMPPVLARGDVGDPITFLKESSGDPEGREILAILIDLLEAGWVRLNPGEPGEMYVWPYFAAMPIDRLTPPQLVELYRILTAADVDEMRAYDSWLFFKIGIGADGTWHYFMVEEP